MAGRHQKGNRYQGQKSPNSQANGGQQQCPICKKTGHTEDKCFYNQKNQTNGNQNNNNRNNSNSNSTQKPVCTNCKKLGHLAQNCRSGNGNRNNSNANSNQQFLCSVCGNLGHFAHECQQTVRKDDYTNGSQFIQCSNCGRAGHLANTCRGKGKNTNQQQQQQQQGQFQNQGQQGGQPKNVHFLEPMEYESGPPTYQAPSYYNEDDEEEAPLFFQQPYQHQQQQYNQQAPPQGQSRAWTDPTGRGVFGALSYDDEGDAIMDEPQIQIPRQQWFQPPQPQAFQQEPQAFGWPPKPAQYPQDPEPYQPAQVFQSSWRQF